MSKVLVLYYSSYGHIEAMAAAVAEGAREAGAQVDIKRVPELVPDEVARKSHLQARSGRSGREDRRPYRLRRNHRRFWHPLRTAVVANGQFPRPGRWPLDARSVATERVGGAFTSTATQHGGQEMTLFSIITNLLALRHGDRRTRLRPCRSETLDEITGGFSVTAQRRLPVVMASVCRPRTSSPGRATRAARLPRPRTSCTVDPHRRPGGNVMKDLETQCFDCGRQRGIAMARRGPYELGPAADTKLGKHPLTWSCTMPR